MTPITLDFSNMVMEHLGVRGVDSERLGGDLADRFRAAHESVEAIRRSGEMGFFELPYDSDALAQAQELADQIEGRFENLVIIGMGGSALGARTLRDALLGSLWNERSNEERAGRPRMYILDNVDPGAVLDVVEYLDLRRTLFNVVSKSGSTAETMALYLVLEGLLIEELGKEKVGEHFVFTTDPENGALRSIAEAEGINSLPIPGNVGGRFSVLSPVGLFPAALAGVDAAALLGGAARADEYCRTPVLGENAAGLMATLLHVAHSELGASIHVLMPYSERLRSFSFWFQQLWAESLGKAHDRSGNVVHTGPTPLPAVGVTDQHAQVQLFMEGPLDKVVIFVALTGTQRDMKIGGHRASVPSVAYLGDHTLGQLMDAERRATAEALRRNGRANMTFEIEYLDASTLGELFMLMSVATIYAGALYDVNPLDQQGVEMGKQLTYGLMGREGYDPPERSDPDVRWRLERG
ncbi:MAG: glucose-6-phosphate isomerase [Gemmatimonadetes bacterium]|nr:glucose-6-phosphate isomerase [Gemmatimonadota bacterium]